MKYVLRKLGFYLIALWAALTLNFFLPRIMPGNPVDQLISKLSQKGQVTPATRHAVELMLGSDSSVPMWQQYLSYFGNIFRGDLGVSVTYFPNSVSSVIGNTLPWTVGLVGISTILAFVFGTILGTLAGWKRGSWIDNLIPVTTLFQSIPYFWLALILLYFFGLKNPIFPLFGGYDVWSVTPGWSWAFIASVIKYGMLPAITIVLSSVGGWMLGMRNMMVSTLSEDYILTAEAKGLSRFKIMTSYAARNAILPSISGFAISLGFVVAGSIVAESVFSYPGIGFALLTAVQNNDYALMQGIFMIITISVLGANLFMDLIYGLIDPRTRAQGRKERHHVNRNIIQDGLEPDRGRKEGTTGAKRQQAQEQSRLDAPAHDSKAGHRPDHRRHHRVLCHRRAVLRPRPEQGKRCGPDRPQR